MLLIQKEKLNLEKHIAHISKFVNVNFLAIFFTKDNYSTCRIKYYKQINAFDMKGGKKIKMSQVRALSTFNKILNLMTASSKSTKIKNIKHLKGSNIYELTKIN